MQEEKKKSRKEGDKARLAAAAARLGVLQRRLKDEKIPVIITFDGFDAAGKGLQISRLIQALDPRGFDVYACDRPTEDEQMRPFVFGLRRILAGMNNTERAAASFIKGLKGTNTNQEFLVRSAKKHSDYEQTF